MMMIGGEIDGMMTTVITVVDTEMVGVARTVMMVDVVHTEMVVDVVRIGTMAEGGMVIAEGMMTGGMVDPLKTGMGMIGVGRVGITDIGVVIDALALIHGIGIMAGDVMTEVEATLTLLIVAGVMVAVVLAVHLILCPGHHPLNILQVVHPQEPVAPTVPGVPSHPTL